MEEKTWVKEYERELDRNKRGEILAAAIGEEGLTPANELREKLLKARFSEVKGQKLDTFIRGWMELQYQLGSRRLFFSERAKEKERKRVRDDFQLPLAASYGEVGKQVIYEEFRNAARLYNNLCSEDRNYTSLLFGLGKMKKTSITRKIASNFYAVSVTVPEKLGMQEELAEFRRALAEVFNELYPEEGGLRPADKE